MPTVFVICGCNGAGKTTASNTLLPRILDCKEFVNADNIASGLSPFQPSNAAIDAGRLMMLRMNQLIRSRTDFAFETTLAAVSYINKIEECKKAGYKISLVYFWLNSVELAIKRIKSRVRKGGHFIPESVVKRRYYRGIKHLFDKFIPICDEWMIIDNSFTHPLLVAEGNKNSPEVVNQRGTWEIIKSIKNEKQQK